MIGREPRADLRHRLLHRQACADSPLGIIRMGRRGAERGHHCVTYVLVDPPPEPIYLFGQPSQASVNEAFHRLRVHPLGDARVPREVGEQDGHRSPLLGAWLLQPRPTYCPVVVVVVVSVVVSAPLAEVGAAAGAAP